MFSQLHNGHSKANRVCTDLSSRSATQYFFILSLHYGAISRNAIFGCCFYAVSDTICVRRAVILCVFLLYSSTTYTPRAERERAALKVEWKSVHRDGTSATQSKTRSVYGKIDKTHADYSKHCRVWPTVNYYHRPILVLLNFSGTEQNYCRLNSFKVRNTLEESYLFSTADALQRTLPSDDTSAMEPRYSCVRSSAEFKRVTSTEKKTATHFISASNAEVYFVDQTKR